MSISSPATTDTATRGVQDAHQKKPLHRRSSWPNSATLAASFRCGCQRSFRCWLRSRTGGMFYCRKLHIPGVGRDHAKNVSRCRQPRRVGVAAAPRLICETQAVTVARLLRCRLCFLARLASLGFVQAVGVAAAPRWELISIGRRVSWSHHRMCTCPKVLADAEWTGAPSGERPDVSQAYARLARALASTACADE